MTDPLIDLVRRMEVECSKERDRTQRANAALADRDFELRQLRSELAEVKALIGTKPGWRYRAFGPNNEIVFDPDVNDRWTMAELGGWRIERQPVYSGPWEQMETVADDDD